ncbi:MAG: hypothetical protein ACRCWB_06295 [Enterovibrio sp.]
MQPTTNATSSQGPSSAPSSEAEGQFAAAFVSNISEQPLTVPKVSYCLPDRLSLLLRDICSDMSDEEGWEAFPYGIESRNLAATKIKEAIDMVDFEEAIVRLDTCSRDGNLYKTLIAIREARSKEAKDDSQQFLGEYDDIKLG